MHSVLHRGLLLLAAQDLCTKKEILMKKSKHLVTYVENCSPKIKIFRSELAARKFVDSFSKKHLGHKDDAWIDLLVTDIKGEIEKLDETTSV
jgi:hypothetical protein